MIHVHEFKFGHANLRCGNNICRKQNCQSHLRTYLEMYDNANVMALLTELQVSPEACLLVHSAASSEENGASSVVDVEAARHFIAMPPSLADVVETTRSLFTSCRDGDCSSADATLALRGSAEVQPVLQQVHRCILSARCPFFQALFSDIWKQPSAAEFDLATEECSGSQAVAVIEYLYTGSIDADVSQAAEIISLANLWQLPGLIDIISNQLTKDPCNNFRRPTGPSDELLVSIPSMASFAAAALEAGIENDSVTSLYESCVAWMARHALLVWPTKAFAQLPDATVSHTRTKAKSLLNAVNGMPQLEQAEKLIARVPQAKWASDLHKIANIWRGEVLQYIADNFPAVILTSAFVERLQSTWCLENLQDIVAAVKLEYGASRNGYALEVYLALQRLQTAAAGEAVVEAEEVQSLLDGLKDHCWSYILRNWHLLQRTPTFKATLPADVRQRLTAEVGDSLVNITNLESPGDKSQSTGFSVLWDASNTQDDSAAANALGPDGKRPVSKATEKRRQRLLEQQQQQQRQQELQQQKARVAKLRQNMADAKRASSASAAASSTAASNTAAAPSTPATPSTAAAPSTPATPSTPAAPDSAALYMQSCGEGAEVLAGRQQVLTSAAETPLHQHSHAADPARSIPDIANQANVSSNGLPARRVSRPSRDTAAAVPPHAGASSAQRRTTAPDQSAGNKQASDWSSRRQSASDLAPARPRVQRAASQNDQARPAGQTQGRRPSSQAQGSRGATLVPRPGLQQHATASAEALSTQNASSQGPLHQGASNDARDVSAAVECAGQLHGAEQVNSQGLQPDHVQGPVRSLSQLQQIRRLSVESKPRFR